MVSKFDYVASGFPLEGPWLKKLQTTLNSVFCGVFGLSDRMAHLFLSLAPENGGLGCPWLTIKADVRYLTSVMKLEHGRSGRGKAVEEELCGGEETGDNVHQTQHLLTVYGI